MKEALTREGRSERDLETLDYVLDFQRLILLSEPEPDDLAREIIEELEAGLSSLRSVLLELTGWRCWRGSGLICEE